MRWNSPSLIFASERQAVRSTNIARAGCQREAIMNPRSVLDWYRVLRSHYHWTTFEAIRFALWLAR
jgi:hypothetical protein